MVVLCQFKTLNRLQSYEKFLTFASARGIFVPIYAKYLHIWIIFRNFVVANDTFTQIDKITKL